MTRIAAHPDATVLLFDFGGTLDAEGIAWKARFVRLWREEVGEVEPESFDRAFYNADDELVGNTPATLPLAETVERLSHSLARRLGGDPEAADRIAARFSREASEHLCASAALLKRLAARYRLGIVSNFYGNLATVCEEAGLSPHLSVAIDSAAVGASKPDPRIFEAALAALAARAGDALFIGDSLARDMAGARGVGMPHVLLAGSGPSAPAAACCPEDPVIRRLADLEEVLA
jgi:putative hydrolase of the HAD superfamily